MNLKEQHCTDRVDKALDTTQAKNLCAQLENNWHLDPDTKSIEFDFQFRNFHETMAFVNAVAWIAHRENHHPDLEVGYKHCQVRYSTHSVGGLSLNDFICAAHIDDLLPRT